MAINKEKLRVGLEKLLQDMGFEHPSHAHRPDYEKYCWIYKIEQMLKDIKEW